MKPLIVANWKMNPQRLVEAKRLFNSIKRRVRSSKNVEVVICPPFIYLATSKKQQATEIKLGGQNCFWKQKGAFTGEISPKMLKNLGCEYVIIGHSERRRNFNETDKIINQKIKAATAIKLKPILCIGESLEEKKRGRTQAVLKSQIIKSLDKIGKKEIKNIIIAYEPVWAIGTGIPCNIETAFSENLLIRKIISQLYTQSTAKNLRILYGGSVDSKNAIGFVKEARMNGLLIGGASLKAKEFIKIIKRVNKA